MDYNKNTSESQTMDHGPRKADHEKRTTNHEPHTTESGPRKADHGKRTTKSDPQTTDHGKQKTESGSRNTNHGKRKTESRKRPTESGPQTTNHEPHTTESGKRITESGSRKTESGKRKTESGSRKAESGQRTTESGKRTTNHGPQKTDRIYIAGHRGMVGSAIHRQLSAAGYKNLVFRTSSELDLKNQAAVQAFFETEKPDYVFLAAAKVGGILANNSYRADFLYENIMIQSNVIHSAYLSGVKKLMFLGSSCIYPKMAPQPLKEEYLLTGLLEPTNEPYAIAKIAGIKMCDAYRAQYNCNFVSVMPTNLYGPNDNYDLKTSHVLPALIRKFHEAKRDKLPFIEMWGTGSPKREFLHVDDLADACLFLMENYNESGLINIGVGEDIAIKDLALMIKNIVGYEGIIKHDFSKPDGTPRKLMDVSKLHKLGWKAKINLEEGIRSVYEEVKTMDWALEKVK